MKVNDTKLFMYFKLSAKVYLNQPNCSKETNESKIEYLFGVGGAGGKYFKIYVSC